MILLNHNKLFILFYWVPMIPTGVLFQFSILYGPPMLCIFFSGKLIIYVDLQRKFLTKCSGILVVVYTRNILCINNVSMAETLFTLCIYYTYILYVSSIYHAYTLYIHGIYYVYVCNILITYMEYITDMSVIYNVYTWNIHSIFFLYTPPSGWCCRGGQGPIPPDPHSTLWIRANEKGNQSDC